MQNGDIPSPGLSQSEDDYEQKESVASEVLSEIDKQEMHVQSDDKSIDRNDDVGPTDVSCLLDHLAGMLWYCMLYILCNYSSAFLVGMIQYLVAGKTCCELFVIYLVGNLSYTW